MFGFGGGLRSVGASLYYHRFVFGSSMMGPQSILALHLRGADPGWLYKTFTQNHTAMALSLWFLDKFLVVLTSGHI